MASDILEPILTACEHLFDVLGTLNEKHNQEEFVLEHIKQCASKDIKIGDFSRSECGERDFRDVIFHDLTVASMNMTVFWDSRR
jgi:hypothetical protein